jgi:outer membrane lipoprotein carrier protein
MKRIGFYIAMMAVSTILYSAPQTPLDIIARLEKTLSSLDSFQADLVQTTFSTSISKPLQEKGRIYFKKPDLMRWEYTDPETYTYVYGEGMLLSYFPEDNQLWRQKISLEQYETEIPALLAGKAHLAEKYVIEPSPFPGAGPNAAQLKLTPKEEGDTDYILLEIDQKSWMIQRAILFDWAGNKTEYGFSKIKTNPRFSKDQFEIKVPPDCEIIEDAAPRKK